jgi:hypothetical protein
MSPSIETTRRKEMTSADIARAQLFLRRRLEDQLSEMHQYSAERCFIQAMIDRLYCLKATDSGAETIIDCVLKLTWQPELGTAFSRSKIDWSAPDAPRVCVPSPSERI